MGAMSRRRDELEVEAWFRDRYGRGSSDAARVLEQRVIGGDFGADGYTTLVQADLIAHRLRLGGDDRTLDVGSGRGWPGLYLAKRTGCSVVLTDLPREGLRTARHRADTEGLGGRASTVVASARRLPFVRESFDAIVHTDVLC